MTVPTRVPAAMSGAFNSADATIELIADRAVRARAEAEIDPEDILSPCISVCCMSDDQSRCVGCFRTIDEIRVWSQSDAAERLAIWSRLLQRAGLDPALIQGARP